MPGSDTDSHELTNLLELWREGDEGAMDRLMPLVYDEMRHVASSYLRRERENHTLQPTALVHEAYMKMLGKSRPQWENRKHFFAVAAKVMRRVLIDHARAHKAAKRGGSRQISVVFDVDQTPDPSHCSPLDMLRLSEALAELEELDARRARVFELRYFSGLSLKEISELVRVSVPVVSKDARWAKAWILTRLSSG